MAELILIAVLSVVAAASLVAVGFLFFKLRHVMVGSKVKQVELQKEIIRSSILAQLASRIGYTLDAEEIIEVISSSLNQLLSFRTVSYLVLDKEKQQLRGRIVAYEPSDPGYIDHVRKTMLNAFQAICTECKNYETKDLVLGPVNPETPSATIGSFFNLPVVFDGVPVGIITVTSTTPGLYTDEQTETLYAITNLASTAITQLKRVIQNEERKMNAMVSSIVTGLFMLDAEERLSVINAPMRHILGIADDAAVSVLDVFERIKDMPSLTPAIKQAKKAEATIALDPVYVGDHWYQMSVSPVRDSKGELLGTVIIFEDITTQKSLERLREQFTAMMVHELRGPLTAIRWNLEILRDKPRVVKADLQKTSNNMLETTGQLLQLVTDMLDAQKIEEGKFEVKKTGQDLVQVAEEVVQSFQSMAKQKGLELVLEKVQPRVFAFDPLRLRQVFTNLVSNAIKYTDSGTISIRFPAAKPDMARVEVVDTGVGVPPQEREKLFKRYGQTKAADTKGGTGLGLLIAKGIVEAHGGTIGYLPSEPHGSVFWFEIPSGV